MTNDDKRLQISVDPTALARDRAHFVEILVREHRRLTVGHATVFF